MAPLLVSNEVNLLLYHYLVESNFLHAAFALRHESALDDHREALSQFVPTGQLIRVLHKGLLYAAVEAHIDKDGNEKRCSAPFRLIGPPHVCDTRPPSPSSASKDEETAPQEGADVPGTSRLTPPPPQRSNSRAKSPSKLREASVQTAPLPTLPKPKITEVADADEEEPGTSSAAAAKASVNGNHKVTAAKSSSGGAKRKGSISEKNGGRDDKRARRDAGDESVVSAKVNGKRRASDEGEDAAPEEEEEDEDEEMDSADETPAPVNSKRKGGRKTKMSASELKERERARKKGKGGGKKGAKAKTAAAASNLPPTALPPLPEAARGKERELRKADLALFSGHSAEVFVSAWNPTVPGLLASGAGDATVRIWDLPAGLGGDEDKAPDDVDPPAVCRHLPATHAKDVSALSWNPDGTLLASGSYDGILRLWTPQGDLHLVLSMHQGPIFGVRWNRRGTSILTGSADGTAIVWDTSSGKVRQQFSLHSDSVLDVDWLTASCPVDDGASSSRAASQADAIFATCSADNTVKILRVGETRPVRTLRGHTDEVNALRFDDTGSLMATVSDDMTARIWTVDRLALGLEASTLRSSTQTDVSAGGRRVTPLGAGRGGRGGSASEEVGVGAADSSDDLPAKTEDTEAGSRSTGPGEVGASADRTSVAASRSPPPAGPVACRFVLTGHTRELYSVSWAPSTSSRQTPLVATTSFDCTARLWNAADGSCVRVIPHHNDAVYAIAFSPDARWIATGGIDCRVYVGSVEDGTIVKQYTGGGGVFDLAWHSEAAPDAKLEDDEGGADDEGDSKPTGLTRRRRPRTYKSHRLAVSQGNRTLAVLDLSQLAQLPESSGSGLMNAEDAPMAA